MYWLPDRHYDVLVVYRNNDIQILKIGNKHAKFTRQGFKESLMTVVHANSTPAELNEFVLVPPFDHQYKYTYRIVLSDTKQ
jgi:hypothetical protein